MRPSLDPGGVLDDLDSLIDRRGEVSAAVETVLIETVKTLAATVPVPRHDPLYGVDRAGGPSLAALERLSRHGDFRKYVHVLDVRAGLGGGARWLASRYGCRVVALDDRPAVVALTDRLSRRAGLREQVRALAGSVVAIPVRDGVFTQIWSVEALHDRDDPVPVLRELFRVLRPGSPIALQEIVAPAGASGAGERRRTARAYCDALAAAGFATIEHDDVTPLRAETSPLVLSARARFERALRERLPRLAVRRDATTAASRAEARPVVQLFARRPST